MAFTEAQRVEIRRFLGWQARFHQMEPALEQAMNAVDGLPDTELMIEGLLTRLASIETRLTDAYTRLKAMKVGSIDLPGGNEIGMLRSEGRRLVGQMAATFGVEVLHDAFSGAGPTGGNYYRHG